MAKGDSSSSSGQQTNQTAQPKFDSGHGGMFGGSTMGDFIPTAARQQNQNQTMQPNQTNGTMIGTKPTSYNFSNQQGALQAALGQGLQGQGAIDWVQQNAPQFNQYGTGISYNPSNNQFGGNGWYAAPGSGQFGMDWINRPMNDGMGSSNNQMGNGGGFLQMLMQAMGGGQNRPAYAGSQLFNRNPQNNVQPQQQQFNRGGMMGSGMPQFDISQYLGQNQSQPSIMAQGNTGRFLGDGRGPDPSMMQYLMQTHPIPANYQPPKPGDMVPNGWGGMKPYDPNDMAIS